METNLLLISFLPDWKQDKRKFEAQAAKGNKGNNKLFNVYQKYEVCKTVNICTRPLECEIVSRITAMVNDIFCFGIKGKSYWKSIVILLSLIATASKHELWRQRSQSPQDIP